MKIQILAFLCCIFACGSAKADWGYTHWGMTPEQVAANSSGAVKVLPKSERTKMGDHWEIAAMGKFRDGSLVLDVGFVFDDKTGLRCVMYNAMQDDVAPVKAELIRRYGPGKASDYGPTHSLTWNNPDNIEMTIGDNPLAVAVVHCLPGG
jgi:hypothetical protein